MNLAFIDLEKDCAIHSKKKKIEGEDCRHMND